MPQIQVPDEFVAYPTHRMLGIVDTDAAADAVIAGLARLGLAHDLWVLTGSAAQEALDADGRSHGWMAWLTRSLQKIGYEHDQFKQYEEAAAAGAWVISPQLDADATHKDEVALLFVRYGGKQVRYLGRMGIEDIHRTPSAL